MAAEDDSHSEVAKAGRGASSDQMVTGAEQTEQTREQRYGLH